MKILVIGGSYFLGGAFTLIASKEHELTLINRGTFSMKRYGVTEFQLDRKDVSALQSIPAQYYDAIVDFCAYEPGDIKLILENIKGVPKLTKKYVFISTVDVYERQVGYIKNENTPIAKTRYSGENGEYIYKKICLENELVEICNKKEIEYTIIRPSIIYGPNDYTKRLENFIKMILNGIAIKYPKDTKAKFQLVYVKDVAQATLVACGKTPSHTYNICSKAINYANVMNTLTEIAEIPVILEPINVKQALEEAKEKKVYLPFPVTEEENEIYDGSKAERELGIQYTSLFDGMKKTYNCF